MEVAHNALSGSPGICNPVTPSNLEFTSSDWKAGIWDTKQNTHSLSPRQGASSEYFCQ